MIRIQINATTTKRAKAHAQHALATVTEGLRPRCNQIKMPGYTLQIDVATDGVVITSEGPVQPA